MVNTAHHVPCGGKCTPESIKDGNCKICPICKRCIDYYHEEDLKKTGGKCLSCFNEGNRKELEENVADYIRDFMQDVI
ncbi:MAG: hypothetical protein ACFFD4_30970 [Candidatus Odinarchaeota archaeon]